ncbi:MAG: hypothetical protein ACI8T1_004448 [Verrucomicrobiales bacterium]|jgi:hypothetical protein
MVDQQVAVDQQVTFHPSRLRTIEPSSSRVDSHMMFRIYDCYHCTCLASMTIWSANSTR